VHIPHRAEQVHRLVDEVTAKVQQDAAAGPGLFGSLPRRQRGAPALEP
jgi:hypothetical protein